MSTSDGASAQWDVIRQHCAATGASLVFSTHSPEVVLREAGHAICLVDGRVLYSGSVKDLYERPASRDLAMMLGPCNWMSADDTREWFDRDSDSIPSGAAASASVNGSCVRPERLTVEVAEGSPLRVESCRVAGTSADIDLCDERSGTIRQFVCRPRAAVDCNPAIE